MRTPRLILAVLTPALPVLLLGCGLVFSGKDGPHGNSMTHIARSGDKEIHFTVREKDLAGGPAWDPSQPLPIPLATIHDLAKAELKKYRKDAETWRVREIALERVNLDPSAPPERGAWMYRVGFELPGTHDHINIPVTLRGTPIAGDIKPLDKSRFQ